MTFSLATTAPKGRRSQNFREKPPHVPSITFIFAAFRFNRHGFTQVGVQRGFEPSKIKNIKKQWLFPLGFGAKSQVTLQRKPL
jgi:hypothetical protein